MFKSIIEVTEGVPPWEKNDLNQSPLTELMSCPITIPGNPTKLKRNKNITKNFSLFNKRDKRPILDLRRITQSFDNNLRITLQDYVQKSSFSRYQQSIKIMSLARPTILFLLHPAHYNFVSCRIYPIIFHAVPSCSWAGPV